jgi:phosphoribosyl 1,2-cyclic phosphodiesterase
MLVHPDIEQEAKRAAAQGRQHARREIFGNDDTFSPLEDVPPVDRLSFISFGSGSSGNCAYIGDDTSGLLIDAGVDMTSVVNELRRNGISMDKVKGIVLTHDHSDHVRFIYTFVRKYRHIAVFCTPRVLNGMLRRHSISNRIKDYHRPIYKEHPFKIGNFTLTAFEVLHDGTDNAGFFITHGHHALTVATDLGCINDRADYYMRQANYLMIEANYDSKMLDDGPYPEYLKARIRSNNGHLDNKDTAAYLAKIYNPNLRNIFLCHLSKDNNKPEIAMKLVEDALHSAGVTEIGDCSESPYARMAPVQLIALPRFQSTGLIPLRLK